MDRSDQILDISGILEDLTEHFIRIHSGYYPGSDINDYIILNPSEEKYFKDLYDNLPEINILSNALDNIDIYGGSDNHIPGFFKPLDPQFLKQYAEMFLFEGDIENKYLDLFQSDSFEYLKFGIARTRAYSALMESYSGKKQAEYIRSNFIESLAESISEESQTLPEKLRFMLTPEQVRYVLDLGESTKDLNKNAYYIWEEKKLPIEVKSLTDKGVHEKIAEKHVRTGFERKFEPFYDKMDNAQARTERFFEEFSRRYPDPRDFIDKVLGF